MLKKNNFFNGHFSKSTKYKKNIVKTEKIYNSFIKDLENNQFPLLKTFEKDYNFDFSKELVKKFSKYKNIVVIGMGGSILGAKSIYSFFKNKIKKKVFF